MVEVLSILIGVGLTVVGLLAVIGIGLAFRTPDHIIDMREVANYHRYTSSIEALDQDVADEEE
jgi:hypothetical protein